MACLGDIALLEMTARTSRLSSRLRNNQRKDNQFNRPIHPDAQASYDDLVEFNAEALRDILADLEEEEED